MAAPDGRGLERALRSLQGQMTSGEGEIVVVGSSPSSFASFDWRRYPEVTLVPAQTELLPGETRNRGIRASTSDLIAFLASDCVAEPGWVSERIKLHGAGFDAVACSVTYAGRRTPWRLGAHYFLFGYRAPARTDRVIVSFPDPRGHGLSLSRALLDRVGGYAEDLRVGEDTDLYFRLGSQPIPIVYSPRIRCAHSAPWTPISVFSDLFRRGRLRADLERLSSIAWLEHDTPRSLALAALTRAAMSARTAISVEGWVIAALSMPWLAAASLSYHLAWHRGRRHGR